MNTRRDLLVHLALGALASSMARAQQLPRTLGNLSPYSRLQAEPFRPVFAQAMRVLGYVEGTDYVGEDRFADGNDRLLPALASELVSLKVDVIVTSTSNGAAAAQAATSSIPIVFEGVSDPVRFGFADSLAHPGHNLTGLSNLSGDLTNKRLAFLQQIIPKLHRVAVLVNPVNRNQSTFAARLAAIAEQTGLELFPVNASASEELEQAFQSIVQRHGEAVLVMPDGYFWRLGVRISELALRYRMPSMFAFPESVEVGGLIGYGVDTFDSVRSQATYVSRIFKGAKPADIPIEQPTKIDLVINRKTADALGLKIPRLILLQATRVIE
ncbi:MAG TPA: ABC transporter substrate-binding protein [Caldimonas sp.]|nr:ABC transporter substrate-binding protein [Caldimonas sp.]HEX4235216.1 ABC transporter substrate-binding protein [Caldimonas sp.]